MCAHTPNLDAPPFVDLLAPSVSSGDATELLVSTAASAPIVSRTIFSSTTHAQSARCFPPPSPQQQGHSPVVKGPGGIPSAPAPRPRRGPATVLGSPLLRLPAEIHLLIFASCPDDSCSALSLLNTCAALRRLVLSRPAFAQRVLFKDAPQLDPTVRKRRAIVCHARKELGQLVRHDVTVWASSEMTVSAVYAHGAGQIGICLQPRTGSSRPEDTDPLSVQDLFPWSYFSVSESKASGLSILPFRLEVPEKHQDALSRSSARLQIAYGNDRMLILRVEMSIWELVASVKGDTSRLPENVINSFAWEGMNCSADGMEECGSVEALFAWFAELPCEDERCALRVGRRMWCRNLEEWSRTPAFVQVDHQGNFLQVNEVLYDTRTFL